MTENDKKKAWEHLRIGDAIEVSNKQIAILYNDCLAAREYLDATLPRSYLAWKQLIEDTNKLQDIIRGRKISNFEDEF